MADPMAMLDMEKRTGIKKTDVDDWVKKTDALQKAISGIADGSLDPEKVSLKKYGILTAAEQDEEHERREKNKREMAARVAKEKAIEKEKEKKKWWEGAFFMYGPLIGSEEWLEEENDKENKKRLERERRSEEQKEHFAYRYSLDYDRWNDSKYKPSDPASKEEEAEIEKKQDQVKMEQFEKANSEWCGMQKDEMDKRNEDRKRREKNADVIRLKGNNFFKQKKYKKAVELYEEAMATTPYKTNILTNLAQCHVKLENWDEVIEYCNRALHVDKQRNVKALSRRAVAYRALGRSNEAEADLEAACGIESDIEGGNDDIRKQLEEVRTEIEGERMEREVAELVVSEGKRVEEARKDLPPPPPDEDEKKAGDEVNSSDGKADGDAKTTEIQLATQDWLQKSMDAMMRGEDFDTPPPISDFEMLDLFTQRVLGGEGGEMLMKTPGSATKEQRKITGGGGLNISALLSRSLDESATNRVYFRTSEHLSKVCSALIQCTSNDAATNDKKVLLMNAISSAVRGDKKSKEIVFTSNAFPFCVSLLYAHRDSAIPSSEMSTPGVMSSACRVLVACCDNEGGECSKAVKMVSTDSEIALAITSLLLQLGGETGAANSSKIDYLSPLQLLRDILLSQPIKASVTANFVPKSPVTTLPAFHPLSALVTLSATLGPRSDAPEIREHAVACMSNLALIPLLRSHFSLGVKLGTKTTSGVKSLLAVARSHKTETPAGRSLALSTLMNCSISAGVSPSSGASSKAETVVHLKGEDEADRLNDVNGIKRTVCAAGGLPILVALATSTSSKVSPPVIKWRASGLLGRCVTNPVCLREMVKNGDGKAIGNVFSKIVLGGGWNDIDEVSGEEKGGMVSDFVRCLAALPNPPSSVDGYILSLVTLLPEPHKDPSEKNVINAKSVCMPPVKRVMGSPSHHAAQDGTLIANVCKALITYLDSGSIDSVLSCGGMERLICLLANSSSIKSENARKNAGAALARIVKGSERAMKRCRELIGMEILVELGKTGKL